MRRNDSWMSPTSSSSYGRGSHSRGSGSSLGRFFRLIILLVVVVVLLSVVQLLRGVPLPNAQSNLTDAVIPGQKPTMPWPSNGSAQVDIQHVGTIGQFNPNNKIELASVAKIITALVIVKDHPLTLGSSGPSVTITAADVSLYLQMYSQQDSVMRVVAGETLNEYQMLEALLLPSADNIAVKLAQWDAGSTSAFVTKMNSFARSLGMNNTTFKDPAGLSTGTVGTVGDQVIAGKMLIKNSVLAQIVAMPQATLPVVGTVFNVNYNIGHDGFIGIKTGSMGTGANLVFAAKGASGSNNLVIGAIMGQQGSQPLTSALSGSKSLVDAARKVPRTESVLSKGQDVGTVSVPGGSSIPIVAASPVSMIGWPGLTIHYVAKLNRLSKNLARGSKVGSLTVSVGSQSRTVDLIITKSIKAPSVAWRLKRL